MVIKKDMAYSQNVSTKHCLKHNIPITIFPLASKGIYIEGIYKDYTIFIFLHVTT